MGCVLPAGESSLDGSKGRFEVRAEALHDRDDGDRDTGGDEPIFNGGGARFISDKAHQNLVHMKFQVDPLHTFFAFAFWLNPLVNFAGGNTYAGIQLAGARR